MDAQLKVEVEGSCEEFLGDERRNLGGLKEVISLLLLLLEEEAKDELSSSNNQPKTHSNMPLIFRE